MKKGKTVKITQYDSLKTIYGTVDSKNLKSLYINIQTWVTPIKDSENWTRVVGNLSREVKHSVYESLDRNLFKENFIVDLDLRTSGIQLEKRSFMNLEITLFTKNQFDIKDQKVKNNIRSICESTINNCLTNKSLFNFYCRKIGG